MGRASVSVDFPILQRLRHNPEVVQDSRNHGAWQRVEGIENAVLAKQMESLQKIFTSMNKTMQLVRVGSGQPTAKQLKQQIGIKTTLADCLDELKLLEEMHQSEYLLKLSVVSVLPNLALKPCASADLSALRRLLVDQPNIPREEVQYIHDIMFAEEKSLEGRLGVLKHSQLEEMVKSSTLTWLKEAALFHISSRDDIYHQHHLL